jgi:hypothetical protein
MMMLKVNKPARIALYTFACLGFMALINITLDGQYALTRFYKDIVLSLFIAVNTVLVLPVVVRFLNKNR